MDENVRLDLLRKLGAVYNDAWNDGAVMDRLNAEPRAVLAEHGIELPATVRVEIKPVEAAEVFWGTSDEFFAEWDRMVDRGLVEVNLSRSRPAGLTTTELADEDLDRVSGGRGCGSPGPGPATCYADSPDQ